jgi:hypothetical protein
VRKLISFLAVIVAAALVPAGPAFGAPPPCVGAWTIDEPVNVVGFPEDIDVAPDGTVVVSMIGSTESRMFRRDVDGTWGALPTVPGRNVSLVADARDDITAVGRVFDATIDALRPVAWRFDGVSWSEEPGLPVERWDIAEVDDVAGTVVVAGWSKPRENALARASILLREEGAWSEVPIEFESPVAGDRLREVSGVAIGGGGRIWIVARWRESRRSLLAARGDDGRWRSWHLPMMDYPLDVDAARGGVAAMGQDKGSELAVIGRPGAWRRVALPLTVAGVIEMRTPSDVWVAPDSAGVPVHIDETDAIRAPVRPTPAHDRFVSQVTTAPDGGIWTIGQTDRLRLVVEHLCPWALGGGPDARVLRTPAPATGVVWRGAEGAGPQIIVDRSPFRLFDEVLGEGEVVSVAYPGVGRYPLRDVRAGRNRVVVIPMLAHQLRGRSPAYIEIVVGYYATFDERDLRAEIEVRGPDDVAYRNAFGRLVDRASDSWRYDQGQGIYRFRARIVVPDGTVGEWSPVKAVTVI